MEYSPPALSSNRDARVLEGGTSRYSGNKKRLSRVIFCWHYVNFVSFRSLSHKPLLIRYLVNNKPLKNERNIQLVSLSLCLKRVCFGFNKILRICSYRSAKRSNGFFNLLVRIVCFLIFEISNRFSKIFDNSYAQRRVSSSICIHPALNNRHPEPVKCGCEELDLHILEYRYKIPR